MTKFAPARPYADPEAAARQFVQLAECRACPGRPHLHRADQRALKDSGLEFGAGIKYAVQQGRLDLHRSGTYVRLAGGVC